MSAEQLISFGLASAVLLAIPGPTVLLVVSYALAGGRRTATPVVAGVGLGDFVAMTASLLGLGVVLATSALLFSILKWVGAAYLIYLGIKLWRAPVGDIAIGPARAEASHRAMFWHAFAVTALNPKSIVFFVAFLPQFMNPAAPMVPQMIAFEIIFLVLAVANAWLYAEMAAAARGAIKRPAIQRAINRTGGALLIGAGAMAALWRRAAPVTG